MSKTKIYIKSVLIPVILGGIVGIIISKSIDYNSLKQPPLSPPSSLFPIVWTVLYILMGISYGILKNDSLITDEVNKTYYTQLFVNLLWPILFFTFKLRLLSLAWIIMLAVLVAVMVIKFYRKNKTAGLIQIPYLLWTVFASYLNLGVYLLNK